MPPAAPEAIPHVTDNNPLALLDKHVDFAALAVEIDRWVPRPSRAAQVRAAAGYSAD